MLSSIVVSSIGLSSVGASSVEYSSSVGASSSVGTSSVDCSAVSSTGSSIFSSDSKNASTGPDSGTGSISGSGSGSGSASLTSGISGLSRFSGLSRISGTAGLSGTTGTTGVSATSGTATLSAASGASGSSPSVSGISSKVTPSFSTTVSNCENGLFTSSFIVLSGVKVILSCPSMSTRSPVLTLTLSRASISTTLKVPSPLTFTTRSVARLSLMRSNIVKTNCSASFLFSPFFSIRTVAISCMEIFSIIRFLHSLPAPST